jgi:hypothetical protein
VSAKLPGQRGIKPKDLSPEKDIEKVEYRVMSVAD